MDIRALECFTILAEELHFRRAAARLNMAQPTLSARIKVLEQEVGVSLLTRNRRDVNLTEAGRIFAKHAALSLRSGQEAILSARRAAKGEIGRLHFGFTGLTSYAAMPELIQRYRLAFPQVEIDLVSSESAKLETSLLSGEIDIALLHPPLAAAGLATKELASQPLVLALPASHPLVELDRVPIRKLAGEPFLIAPRRAGANLYDQIIQFCRQAGFSPNVVQEVTTMTTLVGLAAAGVGCGFVIQSLQALKWPGVVYRPLSGGKIPRLRTALAWRDGDITAAAGGLVKLASAG